MRCRGEFSIKNTNNDGGGDFFCTFVGCMESRGKLYLFPSVMSQGTNAADVLPERNLNLLRSVRFFVVEELRTARRFLKLCDKSIDIDCLHFEVLNEHTPSEEVAEMLKPALEGHDIGVISEAGCPAVADPGSDLVALAHAKGVQVVPLVGPSSILLSLMASGFNGQSFAFCGYLPREQADLRRALREMERAMRRDQTQIFIETPYRNAKLLEELIHSLPGDVKLCVASDLTGENERVISMPLSKWTFAKYDFAKTPSIFLLSN